MTKINVSCILGWLKNPSQDKGIHFANDDGNWDFWSYERLADSVFEFANGLKQQGISQHDVVSLVDTSTPEFVISLFSIMAIGAVPSPIAPPQALQGQQQYIEHVNSILVSAKPAVILVGHKWKLIFEDLIVTDGGPRLVPFEMLRGNAKFGDCLVDSNYNDIAILQFSSGSTGSSRGIYISYGSLIANIRGINSWLEWKDNDITASWLPLYHDMGLIACLIAPVVNQTSLMLMDPRNFIRRPIHYLKCFSDYGASLTAMPNFGLEFIVQRIKPAALEGMNFSNWRALVVGAEVVRQKSLEQLHSLLGPLGFKLGTLLPAYGLAEATLAVAGQRVEQPCWNEFSLNATHFNIGERVHCNEGEKKSHTLISCGRPLDGISISICDESGKELGEGRFGEIVVEGETVGSGYSNLTDLSTTKFLNGKLKTGDGGFIVNGELFVVGRFGDSVKVRGRAIFAEGVEAHLSHLDIPWNRYGVILGLHKEQAAVVILFEDANAQWLVDVKNVITTYTEGAILHLLNTPRGTICRTSSGKIKRRKMWDLFNQGMLEAMPLM